MLRQPKNCRNSKKKCNLIAYIVTFCHLFVSFIKFYKFLFNKPKALRHRCKYTNLTFVLYQYTGMHVSEYMYVFFIFNVFFFFPYSFLIRRKKVLDLTIYALGDLLFSWKEISNYPLVKAFFFFPSRHKGLKILKTIHIY